MTVKEVSRARIDRDQDVFAIRRLGKLIAELSGLENQDQIRVAAALSEVGREMLGGDGGAGVTFALDRDLLRITIDGRGRHSEGVALAGRLMDEITVEPTRIVMLKRLPPGKPELSLAVIRARAAHMSPISAMDELREQNRELVRTLEEVKKLNRELMETNRGVVAMYNQITAELEETNRGVVALYAELDDKSEQLREAIEARNRFWATISHELRTPLNSIIGLARLLTYPPTCRLDEEQKYQVELIASAARALLEMVDELLDIAKAESGYLKPRPTTVNLPYLIDWLRMSLHPTSADITLNIDVADEIREIVTDEMMLTRILRNLLSNAMKFTPQGEVRLTARLDPATDQVVITVADTGIGIPRDEQQRVFEEFYQASNPLQSTVRGSGLGLPYARRLAEALGGTLTLTSEVGKGTTVTLHVPHRTETAEETHV